MFCLRVATYKANQRNASVYVFSEYRNYYGSDLLKNYVALVKKQTIYKLDLKDILMTFIMMKHEGGISWLADTSNHI